MKKSFFTYCFILFTSIAFAQTQKGSFTVGLHNFSPSGILQNSFGATPSNALGIGFGTSIQKVIQGSEFERQTKFSHAGISGNFNYFVMNNFSIGARLNYFTKNETIKENNILINDLDVSLFMTGPELSYYIKVTSKSKIYFRAFASLGTSNSNDGETKNDLTRYGANLGMAYFFNEHFSFDLGGGYDTFIAKLKKPETVKASYTVGSFLMDIGLSIFF